MIAMSASATSTRSNRPRRSQRSFAVMDLAGRQMPEVEFIAGLPDLDQNKKRSHGGHRSQNVREFRADKIRDCKLRRGKRNPAHGCGRQDGAREITGYVLGRFGSTETALADKVFMVATDQAETWLDAGIQKAMSLFNGTIDDSVSERKEQ